MICTGFNWLRIRLLTGACENGNEHWGSIKGGKFLDRLHNYKTSQEGHSSTENELVMLTELQVNIYLAHIRP
jgi:hypothetical protein